MKFYIETRKSEKSGKEYIALLCDNGNKYPIFVTLDVNTISRVSGMSMRELYTLEVGKRVDLV